MNLIKESFQRLFPEKEFSYQTELGYNRRLSSFNANIRFFKNKISVNLNLQWKGIDNEIKIGLIQTLLLKVFKKILNSSAQTTTNIKLYHNFIKNIPLLTPKTKIDPLLEISFQRINEQFFANQMEKPNLTWGTDSRRKLASYNFHNDTVTVSTIFQNVEETVLDYLMYHELLHKHHQFSHKNGRSFYHTPQFKYDEKLYPNQKEIEQQINQIIKQSRRQIKKETKLTQFLKNLKLNNFS